MLSPLIRILLLVLRLQCIEFLSNHIIEENILLNVTSIRITKKKNKNKTRSNTLNHLTPVRGRLGIKIK